MSVGVAVVELTEEVGKAAVSEGSLRSNRLKGSWRLNEVQGLGRQG